MSYKSLDLCVYDAINRLLQADYDSGTTVYTYGCDPAGSRTKLTLPGDLEVVYHYDARGRLVRLADWDGQASDFFYDNAGRHIGTERSRNFCTH